MFARIAAELFNNIGDSLSMFNTWSTAGADFMYLARYDSAQYYLINAYEYFKKADIPEYIIKACINLSGTYYYAGEPDISLIYLRESLEEHKRYESSRTLSRTLLNIGLILADKGKVDNARDTLLLALKESYVYNETSVITDCLNRLALLEVNQGNYNLAIGYYNKLIEASEQWSDRFIMSEALVNISIVYDSLRQGVKAMTAAQEAYDIAVEIESVNQQANAARRLSELYYDMGRYKKAYDLMNEYTDLNNEILNEARSRQMLEMETSYQTRQKQEENRRLSMENELNRLEIIRFRNIFLFTVLMFVMIVSGAFVLIRQNRLRSKQSMIELEQKLFRLQLNPHFIFNALSTIKSCNVEGQREEANKLLSDFANMIRLILVSSEKDLIYISEEIEMIEIYLGIQKRRFPDVFEFEIETGEGLEDDIMVPPMIIQPFAENAIEHGLRPLGRKGRFDIIISQSEGKVEITLSDNGVGREAASKNKKPGHESMSTIITGRRLRNLEKKYRSKFTFNINDLYDSEGNAAGTMVMFEIPDNLSL